MAIENPIPDHAETVACVMSALSTRTLHHFAEEAKQNGESLKDAFERYEIDYAWHVLGSDRLREATLFTLAHRHRCVASDAQRERLAGVLKSAAEAQAPELLMSYDNDVPEKLADFLSAAWASTAAASATN